MSYTHWLEVAKDYQSIIGSVLTGVLSATIALFVSRKVAERGRLIFYPEEFSAKLFKVVERRKEPTEYLEDADEAEVILSYNVYNSSNIRKTVMDICMGTLYRLRGRYLYCKVSLRGVGEATTNIEFEPRKLRWIEFTIRMTRDAISEVMRKDSDIYLVYKDENNKQQRELIGKLTNFMFNQG